jgi:hypothetical protein
VETIDWIAAGSIAYIVGTFALHRTRVSHSRSTGMEPRLLERFNRSRLPLDSPLTAAMDRLETIDRGDYGAVERQAHVVLAGIRKAGGRRGSPALAYLDAHVRLKYLTSSVNLEIETLGALLRAGSALRRFGPCPELHLVRAHAHSLLGNGTAALDELGRALYYAQGDRFYSELVAESGYVERTRPRLRQEALAQLDA